MCKWLINLEPGIAETLLINAKEPEIKELLKYIQELKDSLIGKIAKKKGYFTMNT